MHIITKFLVILASVLAILLAGLTVAYSANADRLVQALDLERNNAIAQKARADGADSRNAANENALRQQIAAKDSELAARENTIADLDQSLIEARAQLQSLVIDQQQQASRMDQFLALSEQDNKLREQQQEEIIDIRQEVNSQARRIIELLDRNADLESELVAMRNQNRALSEEIVQLRGGGSGSGGSVAALPESFRARVTNVITDADGSVLVEINAGSSDRLSKGMELIATRGNSFLGKISLVRVDLNEAVGRVVLTGNGTIRNNDEIRAGT